MNNSHNNGANTDVAPVRKKLLWSLAAATFMVFFQGFMVAPLIPFFTDFFNTDEQTAGLAVPAYLIPYGFATLIYGVLSDKLGRKVLIIGSSVALVILLLATLTSQEITRFIFWRIMTGVGAAAVVPITLTFIADIYPYKERGKPLGLIFAALAGGIAAGKTLGVLVVPFIGWRGLFIAVAVISALILLAIISYRKGFELKDIDRPQVTPKLVLKAYKKFLSSKRGLSTYSNVFINSIFHGGVFTWLGYYFSSRYGLDNIGIALAIIGYGIPGFLFSRKIGQAADRFGRHWLIVTGLGLSAISAIGLIPQWGVVYAAFMVLVLSVGFDFTQPLFAGIVTDIGGKKQGGLAMGLNVFLLFNGFGIGAYVFGELLEKNFTTALLLFAAFEGFLGIAAIWLFRNEKPDKAMKI